MLTSEKSLVGMTQDSQLSLQLGLGWRILSSMRGIARNFIRYGAVGWLLAATLNTFAGDFTWTTNSPDTNTVSIWNYSGPGGVVVVPSNIEGRVVTEIEEGTFSECSNVVEIEIPPTVDVIHEAAFQYSGLTHFVLPDSVSFLGDSAFMGCPDLDNVILGDGISFIDRVMFWEATNLRAVTIGYNVSNIDEYAFLNCTGLEELFFCGDAPTLGHDVFRGASSNVVVYYLAGTEGWGDTFAGYRTEEWVQQESTFSWITNLDGTVTVTGYTGTNPQMEIPSILDFRSVSAIAENAFAGLDFIESVLVPDSVVSIASNVFEGCSNIEQFSLGDGMTHIPHQLFYANSNLTRVEIGNGVTNIEDLTFWGCTSLASVSLGTNILNIGAGAFAGNGSLTNLSIPDSVFKIDMSAFEQCTNLSDVVIGESVAFIEANAFKDCIALTNIHLPSSVARLGITAFGNCANLLGVYCYGNAPSATETVFLNADQVVVYYRSGAMGWGSSFAGRPTVLWQPLSDFTWRTNSADTNTVYLSHYNGLGGDVVIPESYEGKTVTLIGAYAFSQCTNLVSVTMGQDVATIGDGAFSGCSRLAGVVIPDQVANIGLYIFYYCSNMTSVTIGGSVTNIGYRAFDHCGSLTNVIIPDSVTSIGDYAFLYCHGLVSVSMGSNVSNIGTRTFDHCESLRSVIIPDSVINIGDSAFRSCYSLVSATMGSNLSNIGDGAFEFCASLISVDLPNSVTHIGEYAFSHCDSLTHMAIGTGLENIERSSFSQCHNLKSAVFPDNVTNIGWWAFSYCEGLTNVVLGSGVRSIEDGAFFNATNLVSFRVNESNNVFSSENGVLFDKNQTILIRCPGAMEGAYQVPAPVVIIDEGAFFHCGHLQRVEIPETVTLIRDNAFSWCTGLMHVYFRGNAPDPGISIFDGADTNNAAVYFLPGALGWPSVPEPWGGLPTAWWLPEVQSEGMGLHDDEFNFAIAWADGQEVVVEACTNLTNPNWIIVGASIVSNGTSTFSDPAWSNLVGRFYRTVPAP